jgi:quercetin dioxygenase-like cupin family protein
MSPTIEHASEISTAAEPNERPTVVLYQSDRLNWEKLYRSADAGFQRGVLAGPRGTTHETYTIKLPPGQGAPQHAVTGELTICVLQGKVAFVAPATQPEEHHLLSRFDLLFIPEGMQFRYSNVGRSEAILLMIAGRGPGGSWPLSGAYADEG